MFIRAHAGMGDLMMFLPTLHALRIGIPDCEITLNVSEHQRGLAAQLTPGIINKTFYSEGKNILGKAGLLNYVKKTKPELLFISSFCNIPMFGISGAKRELRLSSDQNSVWAKFGYGQFPRKNPKLNHFVDRHLDLPHYLGIEPREICFDIPFREEVVSQANGTIRNHGLEKGMIALIPESNKDYKDLKAHQVQALIDSINNEFNRTVVLFGINQSTTYHGNIIDLREKTGFSEDAYLLRSSGLFASTIGVDTGMMHIAGSVSSDTQGNNARGNKTISLFGPTDPTRYSPYDASGKFNLVIAAAKTDYSHFDGNGYARDKRTRDYMGEISIDKIVEKLEQQLSN